MYDGFGASPVLVPGVPGIRLHLDAQSLSIYKARTERCSVTLSVSLAVSDS